MHDRLVPPGTRPLGLRIIIGYKLARAPLMLAFALWLTLAPRSAIHVAETIALDMSERGAMLGRLGLWIEHHLTKTVAVDTAILALIDGVWAAVEGILLLLGRAWGEWLVIAGLGALVPVEALSLEQNPRLFKLIILAANAVIVAYLVYRRLMPRVRAKG
jgi:uncharacterized membrane protein (DUF2068 family)